MRNNFIYTRIKEGIFQRKIEDHKKKFYSPRDGYKIITKDLNLNVKNFKQYSSSSRGRKKEKKGRRSKKKSRQKNRKKPLPVIIVASKQCRPDSRRQGAPVKGPRKERKLAEAGFASLTGTRVLNRAAEACKHQSIAFSLPKTITGKPNAFSPRKQIKGARPWSSLSNETSLSFRIAAL